MQSLNKTLQVPQLHTAENLVLVSFRLWAHAHASDNMQPVPDWQLGFRAAGLPPCTEGLFDQLLHGIFSGSRHILQIQHLGCVGISPDELTFLQVASLHQNQQPTQAEFLLHQWLMPTVARVCSAMVLGLCQRLESRGYYLPLRPEAEPALSPVQRQAEIHSLTTTVH
ncbi:MAG: hypothetical protein M0Q95_11765 [Porticoccaceae bacterium]|nr:hypothetical protein [Porticoccaceae bacterium]